MQKELIYYPFWIIFKLDMGMKNIILKTCIIDFYMQNFQVITQLDNFNLGLVQIHIYP